MLRVERVEEGPAKQTRRKKTGEGSEVREGVSQCQRAKDNSTLNPQKPIGALELLSQREGGAAKGGGFPCQGHAAADLFPEAALIQKKQASGWLPGMHQPGRSGLRGRFRDCASMPGPCAWLSRN